MILRKKINFLKSDQNHFSLPRFTLSEIKIFLIWVTHLSQYLKKLNPSKMDSPQAKLKSFFNHTISIKNSHTYQDFLRRRPKHAFTFQFIMIRIPERFHHTDERRVQLKLLRALKILKPVTKADLGQLEILDSYSWRTTLPSAWKKIFRVKSLVLVRPQNNSKEKYFRYFVRLQDLSYQLDGFLFDFFADTRRNMLFQNPLECLKYCPKVQSLEVSDYSHEGELTKTSTESTHYLKALESFAFTASRWDEKQAHLPIKFSKNLKSISLFLWNLNSQQLRTQIMTDLSTLPNLQEFGLMTGMDVNSAFITACKKIQKGILKKLTLQLDSKKPQNLTKTLGAFNDCKLTSFSLKISIQQAQVPKSISEFIRSMDQLEALELNIIKTDLFSQRDDFVEICKQINKLQALHSLKLNFSTEEEVPKSSRISNFIPSLCDLFRKPIKIKTLRLECNQLDPSEALQSVISLLENSASSLANLNMNFGTFSCTKKTYRSILKLMENLSNIQVLEIPSLEFNDSNATFLDEIVEAVYALKYLRVFSIGDIKKTVARSTLCRVAKTISSKRGLRKFSCGVNTSIGDDFRKDIDMINMKSIIEKNPYFEFLDFSNTIHNISFSLKVFNWEE